MTSFSVDEEPLDDPGDRTNLAVVGFRFSSSLASTIVNQASEYQKPDRYRHLKNKRPDRFRDQASRVLEFNRAASYSPTQLPTQYHRG